VATDHGNLQLELLVFRILGSNEKRLSRQIR